LATSAKSVSNPETGFWSVLGQWGGIPKKAKHQQEIVFVLVILM